MLRRARSWLAGEVVLWRGIVLLVAVGDILYIASWAVWWALS